MMRISAPIGLLFLVLSSLIPSTLRATTLPVSPQDIGLSIIPLAETTGFACHTATGELGRLKVAANGTSAWLTTGTDQKLIRKLRRQRQRKANLQAQIIRSRLRAFKQQCSLLTAHVLEPLTIPYTSRERIPGVSLPIPASMHIYSETFDGYAVNSNPTAWYDSKKDNSLIRDDLLFRVGVPEPGQHSFATVSEETNIHSHLVTFLSSTWTNYELSGRMRMENAEAGLGVTILSLYPQADRYYRLRRYAGNPAFHLSPHGTSFSSGNLSTGVVPLANTWYRFRLQAEMMPGLTEIRAKVWAEGTSEPAAWQAYGQDLSSSQISNGTIGVWSMAQGKKYWDDFKVTPLNCTIDSDSDGKVDCLDGCSADPLKTAPGACGCGVTDSDSDNDGVPNCIDPCSGLNADGNQNGILDCLEPPQICLSTNGLDFGSSLDELNFQIWNCGGGILNYQISEALNWLSLSASSGSSGDSTPLTHALIASRQGLAAGQYTGILTISAPGALSVQLPVSLTVSMPSGPMTIASRAYGAAPLSVFFDAFSQSSGIIQPASGDFGEFHYAWNFGDPSSGNWNLGTGASKNQASGPIAAHVYQNPGTYTVTLTVTSLQGQRHNYQQAIQVSDPATDPLWQTYYVSQAGSDSNDGLAESRPFRTFEKAATVAGAYKRILFRRADTWTVTSRMSLAAGPMIIGAYGNGAIKPQIVMSAGEAIFRIYGDDIRITDLSLRGTHANSVAFDDGASSDMKFLLINQVLVDGFEIGFLNSHYYPQSHDHNFIVDSQFMNQGNKAVYIGGRRNVILGNYMFNTWSHIVRVWHGIKTLISDNMLVDPLKAPGVDDAGAVIKFHNNLDAAGGLPDGQYNLIARNFIRGYTWAVTVGTQGGWANETVKDSIIERNFFQGSPTLRIACRISAQNILVRNNIGDLTGATDGAKLFSVTRWGVEPAPTGARIFNNILYRGDNLSSLLMESVWVDTVTKNNIAWGPAGLTSIGAQNAASSNNLGSNPFWVSPAYPTWNFGLSAGSPAINSGAAVPVLDDYMGTIRHPSGAATLDLGAFEAVS